MTVVSSSGLNAINAKDGSIKYVHSTTRKQMWIVDYSAEYICPLCRLKEIESGMHVPSLKAANFGAIRT